MRIIFGDCVTEISDAFRVKKQLIFRDYNDKYYHTDDYRFENHAQCALSDLAVNGYIRVENLHSDDWRE